MPIELPDGFLGEEMLSPFGKMLTELCHDRRVPRIRLAERVGVNPTYITACTRDPDEAKKQGLRGHAPRPEYLEPWADELGLEGEERVIFIRLGIDAKVDAADPGAKRRLEEMTQRMHRQEIMLQRLISVCEQFSRQMHEAGIRPQKAVAEELQAVVKDLNADL